MIITVMHSAEGGHEHPVKTLLRVDAQHKWCHKLVSKHSCTQSTQIVPWHRQLLCVECMMCRSLQKDPCATIATLHNSAMIARPESDQHAMCDCCAKRLVQLKPLNRLL